MNRKLFLSLLFITILIFPSSALADGPYLNIPPPNTYWHYKTQNGTSSAQNPYDTVNLIGLRGIKVLNVGNGTILFNATLTNGTGGGGSGSVTPITCSANFQVHQVIVVGNATSFVCAPNNSTGTTLDTMQNLTPAQAYIYAKNNTNFNFQFRGINVTGSLSVSNSSDLITIHGNQYQNNTGSNLGTSGTGVYSGTSGSVLQFFKLIPANNLLGITSNATNVILTIQNVITNAFKFNTTTCSPGYYMTAFSNSTGGYTCTPVSFLSNTVFKSNTITCAANNFVKSFDNTTGIYTCGLPAATGVNSLNFTTSTDFDFRFIPRNMSFVQLIGQVFTFQLKPNVVLTNESAQTVTKPLTLNNLILGGDENVGSNALTINGHRSTLPSTSGILCQANQTSSCGTASGIISSQNIGKGTNSFGVLASPTSQLIRGKNMTAGTGITLSGNTTDNTITNNGILTSQNTGKATGSIGLLNTPTQNNIRSKNMSSTNSFININSNQTDISLNGTVPVSNVVDIYDTVNGDYSTPTAAASSTILTNTTLAATGLYTYDKFNETAGNIIDQCKNVLGTLCTSSFSAQAVIGATKGVTGVSTALNKAINFTAATDRVDTGVIFPDRFMSNTTAKFSVTFWAKNEVTPPSSSAVCATTSKCGVYWGFINSDITVGPMFYHKELNHNYYFIMGRGVAGVPVTNSSFALEPANTSWHLVTVLWNYPNATNNACVSVDGGAFTCVTKSANAAVNTAPVSHIFYGNRVNVDNSCGCAIDDFTIWRSLILTRAQVQSIYNSGNGATIGAESAKYTTGKIFDGLTTTEWRSKSEVHPWAWVDTGSAQILSAGAIYPDKGNTTCLQILYQTSSDANTWNLKRTSNLSLFTTQAWNFLRWDLDGTTERYVRIYCNDAGSAQLALWEEKVLIPSATTLTLRHGHTFIDSTNATLPLNR